MKTKNIMIVGVGGQGSLLASKLLGRLLLTRGYDIKVSEVHGMSQRGGSVVTYVRFGEKVYSPVIDKGEADYIVSFELLEAARWTEFLKPGGKLVANTQQINPMPVITGAAQPMGVGVAKIRLAQEGQLVQVIHALDISGGQALLLHLGAVVGDVVPHMLHLLDEAFVLPCQDLLPRGGFDLRLVIVCHDDHLPL